MQGERNMHFSIPIIRDCSLSFLTRAPIDVFGREVLKQEQLAKEVRAKKVEQEKMQLAAREKVLIAEKDEIIGENRFSIPLLLGALLLYVIFTFW